MWFIIIKQLILQTIYVLNKEILQFLDLKSAVYNHTVNIYRYKAIGANAFPGSWNYTGHVALAPIALYL